MDFLYRFFDFLENYNPKKLYKRSGKCNMCGRCCTNIYVRHGKIPIQTEEEFKKLKRKHDFYSYLEICGKDDIGIIFKCNNLIDGRCKIHKKRPLICRKYPQEEIFMMGGGLCDECGYKFTPKKTFDKVFSEIKKKSKIAK